jgi:hypothetical protein
MSILENSSHNVFRDTSFVNVTYRGAGPNIGESCCFACGSWLGADDDDDDDDEGRQRLHNASLSDATYDSAAQEDLDPPLPVTQHGHLIEELDVLITEGEPSFRALIFSGPRSNLAYLCAKRLQDNLCASFFVSQLLRTDDHVRFFPTIACQLSIQFPAYSNLLEKALRRNPSILHKTLEIQFQKLIVDLVRELLIEGYDFGQRRVIVIDGLEEYGKVQTRLKILRVILDNAGKLPFIWLIFCRPDKASDRYAAEMGPTVEMQWGECYPALKTQTHRSGTVHGFVLLHSRSRFITTPIIEAKNIAMTAFLFFFLDQSTVLTRSLTSGDARLRHTVSHDGAFVTATITTKTVLTPATASHTLSYYISSSSKPPFLSSVLAHLSFHRAFTRV